MANLYVWGKTSTKCSWSDTKSTKVQNTKMLSQKCSLVGLPAKSEIPDKKLGNEPKNLQRIVKGLLSTANLQYVMG